MKLFYKLFLVLLLWSPITVSSQSNGPLQSTYIKWTVVNEGQWGSFYYKIDRTNVKLHGDYYYYVYCYSNSYLHNNGVNYKAITFIDDPTITMYWTDVYGYSKSFVFPMTSAIFDWQPTKICYFHCPAPNAYFEAAWMNISPYDYSRK